MTRKLHWAKSLHRQWESASRQRNMPFKLYADVLLSAAMLAALLLLGALGAPVGREPTNGPAGDPSGEEEGQVPPDLLSASPVWDLIIGETAGHQKEFEDEFHHGVKYHFLDNYKVSSLPAKCPSSNFSMEACLRRLAEGLHTYMVLLKHVEREHPDSSIFLHAKYYSGKLVDLIKTKMKRPGQVTALTSSQEEQLVRDVNSPDPFHRRMTGHSILQQLHDFLREAKVAIRKREKSREMRQESNRIIASFHPSFQILQR